MVSENRNASTLHKGKAIHSNTDIVADAGSPAQPANPETEPTTWEQALEPFVVGTMLVLNISLGTDVLLSCLLKPSNRRSIPQNHHYFDDFCKWDSGISFFLLGVTVMWTISKLTHNREYLSPTLETRDQMKSEKQPKPMSEDTDWTMVNVTGTEVIYQPATANVESTSWERKPTLQTCLYSGMCLLTACCVVPQFFEILLIFVTRIYPVFLGFYTGYTNCQPVDPRPESILPIKAAYVSMATEWQIIKTRGIVDWYEEAEDINWIIPSLTTHLIRNFECLVGGWPWIPYWREFEFGSPNFEAPDSQWKEPEK